MPPPRLLVEALLVMGWEPAEVVPLAGDASARRFFRVTLAGGGSIVACLYPPELAARAAADFEVQQWAWERGLPVPKPLARHGLVVTSGDLGEEDLEGALGSRGEGVLRRALEALGVFQRCSWRDAPTPPFDAAFFRRELSVFEEWVMAPRGPGSPPVAAFLDALSRSLERHPYRLTHRDFHANNLFMVSDRVVAVDFQDMRGGPDTYDVASLLRERAGGRLVTTESRWVEEAATALGWEAGWQRRYLECAAQRGLKVMGTFLRLAACGRPSYLGMLPSVSEKARDAAVALGAPGELLAAVSDAGGL